MTRKNGRVVVKVQVPVLGNVIGTKTLAELITGRAAQKEQQPPVVYKDTNSSPGAKN